MPLPVSPPPPHHSGMPSLRMCVYIYLYKCMCVLPLAVLPKCVRACYSSLPRPERQRQGTLSQPP